MKRRFGLLLGALVLAISAVTMAGCPKTAVSPQGQTGYAVSFGVEGEPANGTLTAKIGGKEFKNKESAPLGATVVFTARPNGGFKVKEWKVDGKTVDGTENTYSLKISKAVDVKVSFEKTSPSPAPTTKRKVNFGVEGGNGTLTAKAGETAITTGAEVEQGKTVLFKAHPDKGYMVESWTGITPASPNATEVTHTVTADITVKVRFKPIPSQTFSVTVEAGEHGKVSVNPSLLEGNKAAKDTVLLFTATADDGFVVDKWTIQGGSFESGTGTDGNSAAKVKVTAAVTVTVSFKAKPAGTVQYKVEHWQQNVTGNDYTKIETDTETKYGKPGENTQAAAKTYAGFTAKPHTQVKIKADGSTVAKIDYDRKEITLTLDLKGGSITTQLAGNKLKGRFGADVPAVANPAKAGYTFSVWNPELPAKFPAQDGTYTAQWKIKTYAVTFGVKDGNGTLKAQADGVPEVSTTTTSSITVEHGKIVTFTAAPDKNYKVKEWKVDGAVITGNTENSYTHTVTKAVDVKVSFILDQPSYTVKHYREQTDGSYPAELAESETLNGTAGENAAYTPKTGGDYEGFIYKPNLTKINGAVQENGTIAADSTTVVELYYERNTVQVSFNLAGGNVGGNADDIVKTGKYGTALTAPVPVKTGAVFKGWEPALPSSPLFPAADTEYAAKWQNVYTINFSVEGGTGGALKAEVDGEEITTGDLAEQGKSVVFTAEPASGYVLEQWTKGGTVIAEAGTDKTYTHTVTADADIKVKFQAPFVEGGVSLILSPDKLDIQVNAVTSDGSAVAVEGCTETSLASGNSTYTELHAKGTVVILKGKITELDCRGNYYNPNKLTALNVQGLTALQGLFCYSSQLTELNVQGLNNLQELRCEGNQFTELNVQGLTALQRLYCNNNQLTALNVQGCTALKELKCNNNQLTALDVQGLNNLQELRCEDNQLTALDVQGCTALKELECYDNKLNADAFKKLFDDLPQRAYSDNARCVLYTEGSSLSEGNHKDFTDPPDLADAFNNAKTVKKWKMYKWNNRELDQL